MTTLAKHPGDCAGEQCRQCWLADNDGTYQALWGLPVTAPPRQRHANVPQPAVYTNGKTLQPIPRGKCIHLGEQTGDTINCRTCAGNVAIKVHRCAVHGRCTPATAVPDTACCVICPDHTERPVPDLLPGLPDPLPVAELQPVPEGWAQREDVIARHIVRLHQLKHADIPPPAQATGDGIVYCGGGRFWPMLVVAVRMARDVTDLPIQIWHRGDAEPVDPADLADVPGVTYHDATKVPLRKLGGWEIKSVALLHCGFERAIFLDADAYLVSDPAAWLAMATPTQPFVFWSDMEGRDRDVKWAAFGIDEAIGRHVPSVQGGQFIVHRAAFWRELVIFHWLCQHSDYSFAHGWGDQSQWSVALALTGRTYHHLGRAPWIGPAFVCSLDDKPLVVHRCQGKVFL